MVENHPFQLNLSDPGISRLKQRATVDGINFLTPANFAIKSMAQAVGAMLDIRLVFSCLADADFLDTVAVPFTVIEQNGTNLQARFGGFPENFVLEHHNLAGLEKNTKSGTLRLGRTDNVVCCLKIGTRPSCSPPTSIAQIAVLKPSSPCRKLRSLMDSVILFVEAQTLPQNLAVPTLRPSRLSSVYHSSVIFTTATQPAFDTL
ncbi:MAG: hypothetical protein IPN90_14005 [Elusimicrobia bacterium]|nr:hypothetical protein [Elusimicrobiota bacterium]